MLKVPRCKTDIIRKMEFDISSGSASDMEAHADYKSRSTILKTPEQTTEYPCRQNHVSSVILHTVPIVSLRIDGKERLCLAQISNTLLKQFSYNEIHNRRVALGITCVQCTPVQLEILRRAGAMPISSRRCGMITKREAERLVKSFLEDNRPPKLPDNFYFEVNHKCGWGCKGKFEPSRYNSSRAKCIRCNFCNLYFSPNKFIFHFHRAPDSKYNHPDAANFNSWRRHLELTPGSDTEDIAHAWEDVKAMFNGGSRKRMVSSPGFPDEHPPTPVSEPKRSKAPVEEEIMNKPNFSNQYQNYPLFSIPGKTYPFNPITAPNQLAFHYQLGKTTTDYTEETKASHAMTYNPWRQPSDFIIPPYDLLWASQLNARAAGNLSNFRQHYINSSSPVKDLSTSDSSLRQSPPSETHSSSDEEEHSFNSQSEHVANATNHRPSAFRPVGKVFQGDGHCKAIEESVTDHEHHGNRNDQDTNHDTCSDRDNDVGDVDDVDDVDDVEDLDIDVVEEVDAADDIKNMSPDTAGCTSLIGGSDVVRVRSAFSPDTSPTTNIVVDYSTQSDNEVNVTHEAVVDKLDGDDSVVDEKSQPQAIEAPPGEAELCNPPANDQSTNNNTAELNLNEKLPYNKDDLDNMSKEELQRRLKSEMDVRKQVEGDINKIKKGLEDQVSKEKSQRDEITRQLQIMKDALCNELEQERKTRLNMQQKLKEAHDALHNFSSQMFTNKPCGECVGKETVRQ